MAIYNVSGAGGGGGSKKHVLKTGDTMTGPLNITNNTTGALTVAGDITGRRVNGAGWNDYAETRSVPDPSVKCGHVVCERGDETLMLSRERLQPLPCVVTDTYGMLIGEPVGHPRPIAVAGWVLVYPCGDRDDYNVGDVLCAGPDGTASRMTRKEIAEYPDRILGRVVSVPQYDVWGADEIRVDGRIWMKIGIA